MYARANWRRDYLSEHRVAIPTISIIVPIHDAEPYLEEFLTSLKSSSFTDFELVVIDDRSEDRGPQIAGASSLVDTLVRLPENRGKTYAVNMGVRASKGEFIVISDPDVTIDSSLLSIWVSEMRSDAKLGVLGAHVYYRDSPTKLTHSGAFCRSFPLRITRLNKDLIDSGQLSRVVEVPRIVLDDIYMVRRPALERVGLFDDANFPMMLEDADLQWRIESAGYRNRVAAGAKAFHNEPTGDGPLFTHYTIRKMCLMSENRLLLFRRHLSPSWANLLISALGALILYSVIATVRFGVREALFNALPALTAATVRGLSRPVLR